MNNKISNIKFNEKYYWTAKQPVQIDNMLLAEDWNKYIPICTYIEVITNLSSVLTTVFDNPVDIPNYLIVKTNDLIPSTSYLSTINNSTQEYVQGITTLKINDIISCGTISAYFLSSNVEIVNTLNEKDGELTSVLTSIKIGEQSFSTSAVNLGNYFTSNQYMVQFINNNLRGEQWVITSLTINNNVYSELDEYYFIKLDDNFGSNFLKKIETLNNATITTTNDQNSIVNIQMYNKCTQCSAILPANILCTFYDVKDWISLTTQNFEVIQPISVKLVNGTLTIKSPSAGILYFLKGY